MIFLDLMKMVPNDLSSRFFGSNKATIVAYHNSYYTVLRHNMLERGVTFWGRSSVA